MQKNGSTIIFFAPILKFWVSHRGQRGKPPKRLSRNRPKMTKNGQKTPKIVQNPKFFKLFQMVPNGPQWPPNGLKWPQNAFLGDLSSFWGHFGRFPPHFGGSPPRAGRTLRSPGSGWEAPPWNPYLSCVAIAKIWRLGAGSLSGQLVAPMDSTSSGR